MWSNEIYFFREIVLLDPKVNFDARLGLKKHVSEIMIDLFSSEFASQDKCQFKSTLNFLSIQAAPNSTQALNLRTVQ